MELKVITMNPAKFVQTNNIISKADRDIEEDKKPLEQENEVST